MRHRVGPRVLLVLAVLFAVPATRAEVQAVADVDALVTQLLAPVPGLALAGGAFLNELSADGLIAPGGGILLSTGVATEASALPAVTANHALGRPGLTFLEEVAGATATIGRDAVMLELVLQAGPRVTGGTFDFVFATDEPIGAPAPTAFNDAFAVRLFRPRDSLNGPNIALHNGSPITVNTAPLVNGSYGVFDRSTAVLTAHFDLTPGEHFALIFMLSDIGVGAGDSAVYLSNLHAVTAPVPEPATAPLLTLGLAAGVLWRVRALPSVRVFRA